MFQNLSLGNYLRFPNSSSLSPTTISQLTALSTAGITSSSRSAANNIVSSAQNSASRYTRAIYIIKIIKKDRVNVIQIIVGEMI